MSYTVYFNDNKGLIINADRSDISASGRILVFSLENEFVASFVINNIIGFVKNEQKTLIHENNKR